MGLLGLEEVVGGLAVGALAVAGELCEGEV